MAELLSNADNYAITTAQVMDYFHGSWALHRYISNFGTLEGSAFFRFDAKQNLNYSEVLTSTQAHSKSAQSTKQYKYIKRESGFDIFFDDGLTQGQLFLPFSFTKASRIYSSHLCAKDHYDGQFHFISPRRYTLRFDVHGPQKDYFILTTFSRLTED